MNRGGAAQRHQRRATASLSGKWLLTNAASPVAGAGWDTLQIIIRRSAARDVER